MSTARIVDIQHCCTHDGPGIRTTVFLKGCPLDCRWCQNPESREPGPELSFKHTLCCSCGKCVAVCPRHAHHIEEKKHYLDRTMCRRCFGCVAVCRGGALEIIGREMTVEDVLREVVKDRVFYETSGGGVTLSGGEPMAGFDFSLALLAALRQTGIHTCVETSGYGAQEDLLKLAHVTDLFLWDIKSTDAGDHLRLTGVPLPPIIENLRAIDEAGAKTILRCPLIADVNLTSGHMENIAALAVSLRNCAGVQLLPYHPFGVAKAAQIGKIGVEYRTPDRKALTDAQAFVEKRITELAAANDAPGV